MNDDIHGLSGAYAVDAVDGDERARFEEHLAVCSQCRAEVESLRAATTHLAGMTDAAPPAHLRAAVLQAITSVRPLPPAVDAPVAQPGEPAHQPADQPAEQPAEQPAHQPATAGREASTPAGPGPADLETRRAERARRIGGVGRWLLGAAAAVLLAVGVVWHPWQPTRPATFDATQRVLQAQDAQRYAKVLDGARATIVRSASLRRAVIIADNMPAAPPGHVYEVWLQHKDGTMVRAGLMPQGSRKQVSLVLDGDAAQAVGAGITVEPAGGSERPTTAPIALFPFA